MYIVKFSTNSNQEFINQPFNARNNKQLQKMVINQSGFIEQLTKDVLDKFGITDFDSSVSELKLLEFTSGKATFTTTKNEEQIIKCFSVILKEMITKYNKLGLENILSFNYKYYECTTKLTGKIAKDVIDDDKFGVQGCNSLTNHFEQLANRCQSKEFNLNVGSNINSLKKHAVDIEKILQVSDDYYKPNSKSYSLSEDKYIFNKMLLFKLDLNNLGLKFNQLKNEKIEDYAKTSYEFYQLVNKNNLDRMLSSLKSETLFAAGDDIFIIVNFGEITQVITVIEQLLMEINNLFEVTEGDGDKVTCAGGLITANYSVPIRMYYDDVEDKLSKAKDNKQQSFVNYLGSNYTFEEFKTIIEQADELISYEKGFTNASTAYYKLLNQLQTNQTLIPLIVLSNAFVNETMKINDNAKIVLLKRENAGRNKLIAIIELALLRAHVVAPTKQQIKAIDYKQKIAILIAEKYKELSLGKLKWLFKDEKSKQIVGTGFLIQLLNIIKGNISQDKKVDEILKLLFTKYNAKYLKLDKEAHMQIEEFVEYTSENISEVESLLYANIINIKIKNFLLGDENEEN